MKANEMSGTGQWHERSAKASGRVIGYGLENSLMAGFYEALESNLGVL